MQSIPFATAAAASARRLLIYKGVGWFAIGDIAQHLHHVDHRAIIVGNVRIIAFAERIELWPAAVGILRGEQVIETPHEGVLVLGFARGLRHQREELHRQGGCAVVDGVGSASPRLRNVGGGARRLGEIGALGPTALRRLILQHAVGDGRAPPRSHTSPAVARGNGCPISCEAIASPSKPRPGATGSDPSAGQSRGEILPPLIHAFGTRMNTFGRGRVRIVNPPVGMQSWKACSSIRPAAARR